jgi:hypothetical protein
VEVLTLEVGMAKRRRAASGEKSIQAPVMLAPDIPV